MGLSGALSNQDHHRRIQLATRHLGQIRKEHDLDLVELPGLLPLHHADLRKRVVQILSEQTGPISPKLLQPMVEARLSRRVKLDTVVNCLWCADKDPRIPIERVGRGLYRFTEAEDTSGSPVSTKVQG